MVAGPVDEDAAERQAARDRALATEDGGETLAGFVREAVRLQAKHQGLIDALVQQGAGLEVRDRLRGPAIDIVTPLVERAHRDGELRADFAAIDVLVTLRMVAVVAVESPDAGRDVDVVLRGLRPQQAHAALPDA